MFCSDSENNYSEDDDTTSFDLALIKAVSERRIIYDRVRNQNYEKFENAWKSISEEMEISVTKCKSRFLTLRKWYVRNKKRIEHGFGKSKKHKQFHAMSFLDPFIKTRNRSRSSSTVGESIQTMTPILSQQNESNQKINPENEIEQIYLVENTIDSNDDINYAINVGDHNDVEVVKEGCPYQGTENEQNDNYGKNHSFEEIILLPEGLQRKEREILKVLNFNDISNKSSSTITNSKGQLGKKEVYNTKRKTAENRAVTNQIITRLRNTDDMEERNKLILNIMNIIFH